MSGAGTMDGVAGVMRGVFSLPPDFPITRATSSADVEGWDSLSHSLFILGVEDAFGIDLPLDKTFELQNVGELADLVDGVRAGT